MARKSKNKKRNRLTKRKEITKRSLFWTNNVLSRYKKRLFRDVKKERLLDDSVVSRRKKFKNKHKFKNTTLRKAKSIKRKLPRSINKIQDEYNKIVLKEKLRQLICSERKIRRQILFANRKTGKGAGPKKWNLDSFVKC